MGEVRQAALRVSATLDSDLFVYRDEWGGRCSVRTTIWSHGCAKLALWDNLDKASLSRGILETCAGRRPCPGS